LDKTCGNKVPADVISKTSEVKVIFHSDTSVTKKGWKLEWTIAEAVTAATGEVISENYPANYNAYMDKEYTIEVADGKQIKINFDTIDIEAGPSCRYDYVLIKDGNGSELLPKTCGTNKPAPVTSTTNKVRVIFHSDSSVQRKGFKLTWTEV